MRTGVIGSLRCRRIVTPICDSGTSRTRASRWSSPTRCARSRGRSDSRTCTSVPARFVTRTCPNSSRIGPRGAWTRTVRSWLFCAARRYCEPDSTCRAQSRRKRTAKTASASIPSTPMRSARAGVRRYGSCARGSGGRNRRDRTRLAKELDLPHAVAPLARAEDAAHERVDREREQNVEEDRWQETVQQHLTCRRRVPEREVEHQRSDLVEDGDDGDREHGCVCAVATRRLAVPSG